MSIKEAIKRLMDMGSIGNAEYGRRLGISAQACWMRLNRRSGKDLTVGISSEMLDALGYELRAVPKVAALRECEIKIGQVSNKGEEVSI